MRKWRAIVAAASCFWMGGASAETASFDLEGYLAQAREKDPGIRRILSERMRTDFAEGLALPSRQLLISALSEFGVRTGTGGVTRTVQVSVSKEFPLLGTSLVVSHENSSQPARDEQVTSIRLQQPLLSNFFGRQNRLTDEAVDLSNQALLLEVLEAYEDYLASAADQFLDLRLAWLNLSAARALYRDSEKFEANVRRRFESDIAASVDLNRVRIQTMERKERVIELETEFETIKTRLSERIGRSADGWVLAETDPEPVMAELPEEDDLRKLAGRGRAVRRARLLSESAERVLSVRKDALLPELNLRAGYTVDQSTRFGTPVQLQEAVGGVAVSIPLWDTQGQAAREEASLERIQADLQHTVAERELLAGLKSAWKRLRRQKERLSLLREKLELARKVVREQTGRYRSGRIDLDSLIQAETSLEESQFAYLAQTVQLHRDWIAWLSASDGLVVKAASE